MPRPEKAEQRDQKRNRRRYQIKRHGGSLGQVYRNAIEKRAKGQK